MKRERLATKETLSISLTASLPACLPSPLPLILSLYHAAVTAPISISLDGVLMALNDITFLIRCQVLLPIATTPDFFTVKGRTSEPNPQSRPQHHLNMAARPSRSMARPSPRLGPV